jgi:hypothetical protein
VIPPLQAGSQRAQGSQSFLCYLIVSIMAQLLKAWERVLASATAKHPGQKDFLVLGPDIDGVIERRPESGIARQFDQICIHYTAVPNRIAGVDQKLERAELRDLSFS